MNHSDSSFRYNSRITPQAYRKLLIFEQASDAGKTREEMQRLGYPPKPSLESFYERALEFSPTRSESLKRTRTRYPNSYRERRI